MEYTETTGMAVITYDHPHRKTQDLLVRLKARGVSPLVLILPWEDRKNHVPLYDVRPKAFSATPDDMCRALKLQCRRGMDVRGMRVLVGGAGILPDWFCSTNEVINAHPGKIPAVRGLDALKWSIYYESEIGVTLHKLDEKVDMGDILEFSEVALTPTDSIHSIAARQYELEVDMLAAVPTAIGVPLSGHAPVGMPFPPGKRMKHRQELQMMSRLAKRIMESPVDV